MAAINLPSHSVFREAREKVNREIGDLIVCLNNKKTEMLNVINVLEKDFTNRQKQKQKEIDKLDNLIAQTEELGENNLLNLQHDIIEKIENQIEQLSVESTQGPDYDVCIEWGFLKKDFISKINNSRIQEIISISEESCSSDDSYDTPVDREMSPSGRGELRGDFIGQRSQDRPRSQWRGVPGYRRPRRRGRGRFRGSRGYEERSGRCPSSDWYEEQRRGTFWRNDSRDQRPRSENVNSRRNW